MTTVNRRSLVRGAAWSAPVVVLTNNLPALAVSVEPGCAGLSIRSACVGGGGSWAFSRPQFTVVSSAPIEVGSTFTLSSIGVAIEFPKFSGTLLDYATITPKGSTRTITVTREIPANTPLTMALRFGFFFKGVAIYALQAVRVNAGTSDCGSRRATATQYGALPLPSACHDS